MVVSLSAKAKNTPLGTSHHQSALLCWFRVPRQVDDDLVLLLLLLVVRFVRESTTGTECYALRRCRRDSGTAMPDY